MDAATALRATRAWVEQAVIGLNLCPFAKAVQVKGRVRYVCSDARDTTTLLTALRAELLRLRDTPIDEVETTLLVHPWVLNDFLEYNDFLDQADALLRGLELEGTLQIASFHPDYQFAGTAPEDIANATNRSPQPTLHLLREASIDRALASGADVDAIVATNLATLRKLGSAGWARLQARILLSAGSPPAD
jgi:hypothetical protein